MTMESLGDVDDAFDIALEHHQSGRLTDAEALYKKILQVDPEHPGALYLLGGIAYQNGNYEFAFELVDKVIRDEPNDPDALHLLGSIAFKLDRQPFALELIERALALNPQYIQAHYSRADVLLAQGQLDHAAAAYRQALGLNPQFTEALCSLGNVLKLQGQLDDAVTSYRQALSLKPDLAFIQASLAEILQAQGKLDEAQTNYRQALAIDPTIAIAHSNLGSILQAKGKFDEAIEHYRQAVALQPDNAQMHNHLGALFSQQGKTDDAIGCYRRALAAQPEFAEAHNNLGSVLREQGKFDEAIACYRQALAVADAAEIHSNLGSVLLQKGSFSEAIASYEQALALKPDFAEIHSYLGLALKHQGQLDRAIQSYEKALSLKPDLAVTHSNLGNVFHDLGRIEEAIACYRRALAIHPEFAEVYTNLGIALKDRGLLKEAIECFQKSRTLKPGFVDAHTNYLVAAQYSPNYSPAQLLADHQDFATQFEAPWRGKWPLHAPQRKTTRRLKVGLVSGDLAEHPVGYFLESALAHFNRQFIEIVLYSTAHRDGQLTQRLKNMGFTWTSLVELSDDQAAQRIRDDNIDILVDLSGHTAYNRLQIFVRKPAPLQASWIGYWATTGLQAIDYILCDRYVLPEDEIEFFVEKPWYLPNTRLCFTPPRNEITPNALPALTDKRITFGCFNNLTKMSDAVVALWSRLLHSVPGSRLFLKTKALTDVATQASVLARFATHGIAAEQLLLEGHSSHADYLAAYHKVDISLDPFPFTGATTSVEGLWMGVPLITLRGDRMVAHQGEGILHNIGLPEWIAADAADYVAIATAKANDLQGLAELRAQLRTKLLTSPLCDGKLFALNLEKAFLEMWEKHCTES